MHVGRVLRSPYFGLYDAMTALEVGNPKMDPGVRMPGLADAKAGIAETHARTSALSTGTVRNILCEILRAEATWLSGAGLGQTLFTCLWLHRPSEIADPALRAYAVFTVHCARILHGFLTDCVSAGVLYEV